jgi:hypothetical protein|tara:strand:+ start:1856 stop:2539 length:684 start_codon:yes stop_codon:yes gene_type:complete
MGYLNNQIITVDAILTKKGRELLAKGDGSFNITQFALSDDEVDYTLYNPNHPSGSAFYGEAIENMPLLEAFPDEAQMMKYKLVTLPRQTAKMPILAGSGIGPLLKIPQLSSETITPETLNYLNGTKFEPSGYSFTISDVRVTSQFFGSGVQTKAAQALAAQNANMSITNGTATSQTVIGTSCTIVATGVNTLFGSNNVLYATLIVVGLDSGARASVPIQVTKTTTAS